MTKEQVIKKYEDMMYKYGEFDVWDDDIKPKLTSRTTEEVRRMYMEDKKFYEAREAAGGCW